jgi:hypothetical protein
MVFDLAQTLPELDPDARVDRGFAQYPAERAAHQRDAADRRLGQHAAGLIVKDEAVVRKSQPRDALTETQHLERVEPVRREIEKRSGLIARRRTAFVDG